MPFETIQQRENRMMPSVRFELARQEKGFTGGVSGLRVIVSTAIAVAGALLLGSGFQNYRYDGVWEIEYALFAIIGACLLYWGISLVLKPWRLSRRRRALWLREVEALRFERSNRLALALAQQPLLTFPELMYGLGWTEAAVFDGLTLAIERGLVVEDYDTTRMQYCYGSTNILVAQTKEFEDFDAQLKRAEHEAATRAPAPVHENKGWWP